MIVDPFDIVGLPDYVAKIARWRARRMLKRFTFELAPGQVVWPIHRLAPRPRDPLLMVMRPAEGRAAGADKN